MNTAKLLKTDALFLGRVVAQMAVVSLLVGTALMAINKLMFYSPWNMVLMAGIPFMVSSIFHRGIRTWFIGGLSLTPWTWFSVFMTIASFAIEP